MVVYVFKNSRATEDSLKSMYPCITLLHSVCCIVSIGCVIMCAREVRTLSVGRVGPIKDSLRPGTQGPTYFLYVCALVFWESIGFLLSFSCGG